MLRASVLLLLFCLASCAEIKVQPYAVTALRQPQLTESALITSDNQRLPVKHWLPKDTPRAVIIALHGMNDYSNAFAMPGEFLSAKGIALYAYDQRGFGASPSPGIWPGEENLKSDLRDMIAATRRLHPNIPLYVLGESMGGAIAIITLSEPGAPKVEGIILSAPAVWGADAMNPFFRASLWVVAHVMPDKILTGEGLNILASDNIPMLRALSADPLVLKGTRTDSVLGLVRLMGNGYEKLHALPYPLLVIYGKHDEVIPPWAIRGALHERGLMLYPKGFHMLLRDIHRDVPTADIAAWVISPSGKLPSGEAAKPQDLETLESQWGRSRKPPSPPKGPAHIRK